MSLFYIGLNPRWQNYSWLPDKINVMFSAAGYWNDGEWRKNQRFFTRSGLRFLDSGGFTLLNKYGDYPFSVVEFMNLVAWLRPHFYASLDYPCEPEISRTLSLQSNAERIRATVANAVLMSEWESHVSGTMVPVIQGYSLDEYKTCIDQHQQAGTIRPYMAVGSMCRRLSSQELHHLVPGIYNHALLGGANRLHFFGLKLSPDLIDLSEFIYSRDSAVGLYDYGNLRASRNGRIWPRGQAEKREAFEVFFDRLDLLGLTYKDV